MIAKAGKPFAEGEFIKECMLQAASIVCPEKRAQFASISLSPNTVAERVTELSGNIYGQLRLPSSQMWLSCVRESAVRSLAAKSRQESPMF